MQGKLLYLALGCIAGVVGVFAISATQQPDTVPFELIEKAETKQASTFRSPLAVVPEETPTPELKTESEAVTVDAAQAVITEDQFLELATRLEDAEARIASLELSLTNGAPLSSIEPEPQEPDLIAAGFDPFIVDEIKTIRNDAQLQRLELRDRATREGWINTDQFRQSIRDLRGSNKLRESLGDQDYDRLLLAEGSDNRIAVDSVIENSAADLAGIKAGDIIYRYADVRLFNYRDLRNASTAGEKDEPVTIQVMRDGSLIDLVIPRGPLGVTISPVTEVGSP